MSGVMMLNHIHEEATADRIKSAYDAVLREGKTLTRDLGGSATLDTGPGRGTEWEVRVPNTRGAK